MKNRIGKYILLVVMGFALVGLLQTPSAYAKDSVARPFRIAGQLTFLDGFGAPPWTILDQGVASVLGKFTDIGKFNADFSGFGIFYAADGDQLFWRAVDSDTMELIGGTGRFENATGSFDYVMSAPEYLPGPEGTVTVVVMYTGKGTITMGK